MARGLPDAYKEDNISLMGIKKRFIYGFGGGSILKDAPPSNGEERILRFDEAKLWKSWVSLKLKGIENGWSYGLIDLGFCSEKLF